MHLHSYILVKYEYICAMCVYMSIYIYIYTRIYIYCTSTSTGIRVMFNISRREGWASWTQAVAMKCNTNTRSTVGSSRRACAPSLRRSTSSATISRSSNSAIMPAAASSHSSRAPTRVHYFSLLVLRHMRVTFTISKSILQIYSLKTKSLYMR